MGTAAQQQAAGTFYDITASYFIPPKLIFPCKVNISETRLFRIVNFEKMLSSAKQCSVL